MKRWLALLAGGFGLAAYLRRRRRSARVELAPADELRAKLAETRVGDPRRPVEAETAAAVETEVAPGELAQHRRDVHDRARAAIDELG